jgi:hypothetical protein
MVMLMLAQEPLLKQCPSVVPGVLQGGPLGWSASAGAHRPLLGAVLHVWSLGPCESLGDSGGGGGDPPRQAKAHRQHCKQLDVELKGVGQGAALACVYNGVAMRVSECVLAVEQVHMPSISGEVAAACEATGMGPHWGAVSEQLQGLQVCHMPLGTPWQLQGGPCP